MGAEATLGRPALRVVRPDDLPPGAERARAVRRARRTLALLVLAAAALTLTGLVMVLSASSVSAFAHYGSSFLFFKRQLAYAALGAVLALAASRLPHRVWRRAWVPLLGGVLVLLVLVLHPSVGTVAGGAARWLSLGPVTFQPSEPAKLLVVMAAATVLAGRRAWSEPPSRWAVPLLLPAAAVILLVLAQPDFGTAAVTAGAVLVVLFLAGVPLRYLAMCVAAAGAAAAGLVLGWDYRRERVLSFLDPWADPRNAGYQVVQSLIALGSGHLFGVGLGASRQKWMYVPNAHTDFIFAILGEETGMVGALVVLLLFAVLLAAGVRIALRAPDAFGRLLAGGLTGLIGLQALVNLGAVTGLLPITGVPLPFISFGGSALVVSLVAVGILWSVGRAGVAAAASGGGDGRRGGGGRRRPPRGRGSP